VPFSVLGVGREPQAGAADFFVKGIDTQRLIEHLLAVHASRGVRPALLHRDS
jgi:hypothetical protein